MVQDTKESNSILIFIIPIVLILIIVGLIGFSIKNKNHGPAKTLNLDTLVQELQVARDNPNTLNQGKVIYITQCQVCHGNLGQGITGPNLTDKYWKHGKGSTEELAQFIFEGNPSIGMPAWGPIIKHEDLIAVTIYVKSLQGTNPPGAKRPEGTPY